ncbi:hypothetical protein JOL62DRAFT_560605 [Phyllosticta paracitricarpa]|uniref:Uncharacterized protein n=1 Tax=Phyllosticta paracitricarpa TaxID=2016321 RepID=A0ABR1MSN1_9PEZI
MTSYLQGMIKGLPFSYCMFNPSLTADHETVRHTITLHFLALRPTTALPRIQRTTQTSMLLLHILLAAQSRRPLDPQPRRSCVIFTQQVFTVATRGERRAQNRNGPRQRARRRHGPRLADPKVLTDDRISREPHIVLSPFASKRDLGVLSRFWRGYQSFLFRSFSYDYLTTRDDMLPRAAVVPLTSTSTTPSQNQKPSMVACPTLKCLGDAFPLIFGILIKHKTGSPPWRCLHPGKGPVRSCMFWSLEPSHARCRWLSTTRVDQLHLLGNGRLELDKFADRVTHEDRKMPQVERALAVADARHETVSSEEEAIQVDYKLSKRPFIESQEAVKCPVSSPLAQMNGSPLPDSAEVTWAEEALATAIGNAVVATTKATASAAAHKSVCRAHASS